MAIARRHPQVINVFQRFTLPKSSVIQTRKKSARWPRRAWKPRLAAATGCVFLPLKVRRSATTTEKISAK